MEESVFEKPLSNITTSGSSTENEKIIANISITTEDIISFISLNIMNKLLENRKQTNEKPINKNDILYSNKIPLISIKNYFIRIVKYSKIHNDTLILIIIYIKRFIIKEKFIISFSNIYKLILGCSVLAIKYNESRIYKNSFYAEIGGFELKEFNLIEINLFRRLDFDLFIFDFEYNDVIKKIINEKLSGFL